MAQARTTSAAATETAKATATTTVASKNRVTAHIHPNHPLAAAENRTDATRVDGGRHLPHSPSHSTSTSTTLHFDLRRTKVSWPEDDIRGNGFRSLPSLRDRDERLSFESSSRTMADRHRVLSDNRHVTPAFGAHGSLPDSLSHPRAQRVGMPALNTGDNHLEMKAGDLERGSQSLPTSRWSYLGPSTKRHSDGSIHTPRSTLQGMASTKAPPAHDRRDLSPHTLGYSTNNNHSTQPRQRPVRIGEEGYYGPQELEVLYRFWYPTMGRHQESRSSRYSSPMETQERASSEDDRVTTFRSTGKGKESRTNAWQDERRDQEIERYTYNMRDSRGYSHGVESSDNGTNTGDNFNDDGRDGDVPSLMDVDDENLDLEDEDEDEDNEDDDADDGEGAPLGRTQSRDSGDGSESSVGCQMDATNTGFALVGRSADDAKARPGADEGKPGATKPNRRLRGQESKNHRCKECGKKFSRPSQLQTHSFTHNGLVSESERLALHLWTLIFTLCHSLS